MNGKLTSHRAKPAKIREFKVIVEKVCGEHYRRGQGGGAGLGLAGATKGIYCLILADIASTE